MTSILPRARFTRGETFVVAVEATTGDVSEATCRMVLKAAVKGRAPGDAAAEAAVFSVVSVEEVDDQAETPKPGWICTLSATDSANLVAGLYLLDARIVIAGAVVQSDTVRITVDERITEAAA